MPKFRKKPVVIDMRVALILGFVLLVSVATGAQTCTGNCGGYPVTIRLDVDGVASIDYAGRHFVPEEEQMTPERAFAKAYATATAYGWTPVVLLAVLLTCLRLRASSEVTIDDVGNDSEHFDDGRDDEDEDDE